MRLFYLTLLLILNFASCASYRVPISPKRDTTLQKGDGKEVVSRPLPQGSAPRELYVRKSEIKIESEDLENDTGSLMKLDDSRNHLFTNNQILKPGSFINVKVVSNRVDPPKDPKDGKGKDPKDKKTDIPGGDEFETGVLKSFPNLEPAEGKPELLREFKMEVTNILENSDALVMFKRNSKHEDLANETLIRARIPSNRLNSGDDITTNDLMDVSWDQSHEGQIVERHSPNWEDEYTLRLSKFDEAKSKSAMAMQEQKKQLQEIRDKLDTRLKTMSQERQLVAKQREELNRKAKENEEKMANMEKENQEKTAEIEKHKQELEDKNKEIEEQKKSADEADAKGDAKPKAGKAPEKSGDKKDGASGKK